MKNTHQNAFVTCLLQEKAKEGAEKAAQKSSGQQEVGQYLLNVHQYPDDGDLQVLE